MTHLVLDLETGFKEVNGRKGHFLYNSIIAIGIAQDGISKSYYVKDEQENVNNILEMILKGESTIVGHNIKYDILYLWKYEAFQDWLKQGGKVYCTMLGEYMLTAQQHKFAALRDIAVNKYGCQEREKLMEKYWEQGIDTGNIPKELVLTDVENDVLDTEKVYLGQMKKSKQENMITLLELEMDALLATTEMEYNGIKIDVEVKDKNQKFLEEKINEKEKQLLKLIEPYWREANAKEKS